jgi:hypothetical protein
VTRPNVLLVILDATRRDALEPYGARAGSTPTIAQLASRGTALPEVHATGCWTVPSHASLFTGLMPRAAGLARVPSPAAAKPVVEGHRDRLLPELMRRAGYRTGALTANLWLSAATGFATGFDDFAAVDTDRNAQIHLTSPRERARWLVEAARARVDDGAARVGSMLDAWVADSARRPFFWFVNLLEAHSPYLPPRPYGDLSLIERLRAAEDARRHYQLTAIWRACAGVEQVPEATLDRMRRLYGASVRYMDDWLAGVLERLDGAGVLDDTLVVVTADHGENLGENGFIGHALSLDERLIHVPFVMAGPGSDATIASLAEAPALIARAVGIGEHPWGHAVPAGVGVAQLDPPLEPGDDETAARFEELGLGPARELLSTPQTCAVAGGLKLLRRGRTEEVFDLRADPLEAEPQSPDRIAGDGRAAELARLREALDHPAVTARADSSPPADAGDAASQEELDAIEARMKLLGYM